MPTRTDKRDSRLRRATVLSLVLMGPLLLILGCGEPSVRELKNRRELEALLTAVSLKNKSELEKDIKRIDERHNSGELSDQGYNDLQEIIKKAQAGNWERGREAGVPAS